MKNSMRRNLMWLYKFSISLSYHAAASHQTSLLFPGLFWPPHIHVNPYSMHTKHADISSLGMVTLKHTHQFFWLMESNSTPFEYRLALVTHLEPVEYGESDVACLLRISPTKVIQLWPGFVSLSKHVLWGPGPPCNQACYSETTCWRDQNDKILRDRECL